MILDAVKKAKEVYNQFKGNDTDPLDLDLIIQHQGIIPISYDFPDYIRGCLMYVKNYIYMGININHINNYPNLAKFTKGHELGHFFCHDRKLYFCAEDDMNKIEVEANAFAAELIMPSPIIKKIYKQMTTEELSKYFSVSQEALIYRLNNLGLI